MAGDVLGAVAGPIIGGIMGGGDSQPVGNTAGGAFYDPYAAYRGQAATQLNSLIYGGGSMDAIKGMPGYQFGMDQGVQALNRTMSQTGQTQSGAQQIALSEFGQGYAGSFYDKMISNLMGMSGATSNPMNVQGQNLANQNQANLNQANTMGAIGAGIKGLSTVFNNSGTSYLNSSQASNDYFNFQQGMGY